MTVALTASLGGAAVPAGSSPSRSRSNEGSVSIAAKPSAPTTLSLYVGKAASVPTTYAALSTPAFVSDGVSADRLTYQNVPAGWNVQIAFSGVDLTGFTIGDHLWLCLFEVGPTPAGGDAVAAHKDLGLCVA